MAQSLWPQLVQARPHTNVADTCHWDEAQRSTKFLEKCQPWINNDLYIFPHNQFPQNRKDDERCIFIGVNKKLGGYAQKVISEKLLSLSLVNVATNPPHSTYFLCQSRALQWSSTGKFASGPPHVGSWNRKRERSTWMTVPPSSSRRWYIGKFIILTYCNLWFPFCCFLLLT